MEVEKALIIKKNQIVEDTDESLSVATSNCPLFIKARGYDDVCVSEEETDFPIAYSLVVHKYAWMVERLIKAIYSPANIYCIHYDEKSPASFKSAIKSLASCLPNVFIASKIEYVYYTSFSRVQADLNCFSDLLRSEVKWKYLINLCGQDFPLRTNIELVSELKKLNGANMLETTRPTEYKQQRFTYHHELVGNSDLNKWLVGTDQLKSPPPHGIEMFVGNAYFVLSRDFIVYMNSSAVVKDFLKWSEDTYDPEEHIWATLVRMPGVPGEVPRSHPDITDLMSKTRLVKWLGIQTFHKYNINCLAIYDFDPMEVEKALIIKKNQIVKDTDESLSVATSNCPLFIKTRGYDDVCVSEEETDFPIAYSLVVHKYAWMVERLIKAIYSPANIYCIHYDEKSPASFKSAIKSLASCLPNVFIASKIEYVYYTSFSRVQADLNCFSDLLRSEVKWKYLINLCGQDVPLRTNIELVSELKKLNGTNMLETTRPPEHKKQRFTLHYKLEGNSDLNKWLVGTDQLKSPPPHGIEMFVGNAYFVLSRDFIVYMNSSAVVKDFLKWSEDTFSPDEHIWATLVRMPGVPGEVPRSHPDITDLMSKTRLVKWLGTDLHLYPACSGIYIRGVCIYSLGELRWLLNYGHWFANKFDTNVDPIPLQCLEEKMEKRRKLFGC
ncbi:beta-1%2C3-galactosyl-O-glycosyl-glycoprotein beta-1,6-N-acetylglucosaminyltransferase 4-like [Xyrichtys novacula]|uniref:Beta-1,3-galactosyl-O-glycosyl-glycoprotein beta-1,6-N-acetylglucosaminyltransferase 4-like n=1 Tax=Xyrichtys novacula TaxID=13765 RepID=A0AAV1GC16_XYRNO|nr:beta-1%2C3-galactosyl-O-glycosyl-glycoprotein beta-1,6-N-acetylglucosaminyltransferase 4-like [Xyrichtys novacula]